MNRPQDSFGDAPKMAGVLIAGTLANTPAVLGASDPRDTAHDRAGALRHRRSRYIPDRVMARIALSRVQQRPERDVCMRAFTGPSRCQSGANEYIALMLGLDTGQLAA